MRRDNIVLSGRLKFISIGDLLQLLGSNSSTGVLRISSRCSSQPAFIYFEKGSPINAVYGALAGLDAVYALFGWMDGEFEFSRENHSSPVLITKSRMSIILEGLKMVDEGQIKKIRPSYALDKHRFQAGPDCVPVVTGPMVDYMYVADEESFLDGANIVEQGKHGGWIWVVLEGVVQIIKNTSEGTLPLARLGEGSFIGSLSSFLIQGHVRTATAIAMGNVQLGVLDSQRLSQEFARMTPEFRALLISLDKRFKLVTELMVDLRLKPNGRKTDDEFKKALADAREIVQQGSTQEELYIVDEGPAFVVSRETQDPLKVATLSSGDYFGRIPFIDMGHEPEGASILAGRHCAFRKLDPSRFSQEYRSLSLTFKNFVDNVAACISVTTDVVRNLWTNNPAGPPADRA
jgi:CRP-like cAMP-binding protein